MEPLSPPSTSDPSSHVVPSGLNSKDNTTSIPIVVHKSKTIAGLTPEEPTATSSPPSTTSHSFNDTYTHGLDLPWVTRESKQSPTVTLTVPSSPSYHALSHRVSELNLSAHPSRSSHSRKSQSRTACFIHSLLAQPSGAKGRSLSRTGSSDDLTRGSPHEVINKGPERRDRWNRGMTKKELSDMALGVRELSKRLGSARMKLRVKTIIIITKKHDHALVGMTREVTDFLLHHAEGKKDPYTIYVDQDFETSPAFDYQGLVKQNPPNHERVKFWTPELCLRKPHLFDFVITLGGDGTVLYASWLFQRVVPPVASFSLGSLGFLTPFDFSDFRYTLAESFDRGVTARLRMRFECTIMRVAESPIFDDTDDGPDFLEMHFQQKRDRGAENAVNHHTEEYWKSTRASEMSNADRVKEDDGLNMIHRPSESFAVLNELVVDRGPNPFLSTLELYGDEEHLTSVVADGLVIATPTGSTAYSLSAGGSLVHPEIPAILISPICPHTLSFRPLLVPDSMVLRVVVPSDSRSTAWCSFDGRNRVELKQGDYVFISASRFPFPTVLKQKDAGDWFDSISRTLNWNERKRQKKFDDPADGKRT